MADIALGVRPPPFVLPSYSLTSDLLSFQRCGLQYRMTGIGRLPSSEPVQMWFGQFIHGVMEEAYRRFAAHPLAYASGWADAEIDEVIVLIDARLSAQGLRAWEEKGRELGYERARVAVRELGADLFPLIHRAEVRLTGSRRLDPPRAGVERYEIAGVVDVITYVELTNPDLADNSLVRAIRRALGGALPNEFEVIIDYKGTRRPAERGDPFGEIYKWQVQTYGHLRGQQEDSLPVAAGMVLYLNELYPSAGDITKLRKEMREGTADIVPAAGSDAERILSGRGDATHDRLPIAFRLERAIRVYPISGATIREALAAFDGVVGRIETCRASERTTGQVISAWEKNASDEGTCAACDTRTVCTAYRRENEPAVPGLA